MKILLVGGEGNLGIGCETYLNRIGVNTIVWDVSRDIFSLSQDILLKSHIDLVINFSVVVDQKTVRIIPTNEDFRVNVLGLFHLLEVCRETDIPLIQISTREVIGTRDYRINKADPKDELRAIGELEPCLPRNSYGKTKLISEWILSEDSNSAVIRLNTCYTDNWKSGKGLIGTLVRKSRVDGAITLDNLGRALRDPLHINDLTDLILKVYQNKFYGKIIHAGGGLNNLLTLREICTLANPKVNIYPGVVGSDFGFFMDISLATSIGWNPKITFSSWIDNN